MAHSTLNSQGVLKASSCSSTGFRLHRGRWQMPLLFSHWQCSWQVPVCSWQHQQLCLMSACVAGERNDWGRGCILKWKIKFWKKKYTVFGPPWLRICLAMQGSGVQFLVRGTKIPHALGQLSLSATTTEAHRTQLKSLWAATTVPTPGRCLRKNCKQNKKAKRHKSYANFKQGVCFYLCRLTCYNKQQQTKYCCKTT